MTGAARRARRAGLLAALALLAAAGPAHAAGPGEGEARRRVLVIGLDGTRGDVFHRVVWQEGDAPALRGLLAAGVFAACPEPGAAGCARAHSGPALDRSFQWVTASGWAAVLSGVDAGRHGVRDNPHPLLSAYCESSRTHPSFLMLAKRRGLGIAAGGVGAFLSSVDGDGIYPGVVDYECGCGAEASLVAVDATASCNLDWRLAPASRDPARDRALADFLAERIRDPAAAVVMGVFDRIDEAGHRHGFELGDEVRAALRETDALVAPLLAEVAHGVRERGEAWLVVLTADHGGHDRLFGLFGEHGDRRGRDDIVPFALARYGPGPALGPLRLPITHMDVHPTVLRWLRIDPERGAVDGRIQGLSEP